MANNIIPLDPNNFTSEVYSTSDESLITSNIETNQFDPNIDYAEFFVFDLNGNKISPVGNDATFSNYSLLDNEIYIDPVVDLERVGIDTGIVNTLYNFYRKRLSSSPQSTYFISEISSNRTEIRLDSNIIDREDIISSTNEFISYREEDETFPDFYINFGSNLLFIANNIRLEEDGTILIKLYEPLPANIEVKTSLWVVEKVSNGNAYRVEFEDTQVFRPQFNSLRGPNFNLALQDQLNNSSEAVSTSDFTSPNTQSSAQLNSYFEDPSIQINVDYSEFENFVNFSSVEARLSNFLDKVSLIESSSNQINALSGITNTSAVSSSKATIQGVIDSTIENFDSYEYFLYFESGSTNYPKSNSTAPYTNVSTGSAAAIAWSSSLFQSASLYDELNQNWLKYSIPEYLRDDPANAQYLTFVNMVGHFVDNNIWLYIKDTTNKWNADNRINAGISKDLVAQVLRDLGVKIYQNNYSVGDLYSSFLGFTDSGSLFPYPYMTGSLPTPEGYEYISNFISSSNDAVPLDDINKRIYKRIYHNLPYLLKSKGTVEGLRTLTNIYGIPDTILQINEFGGKDKNNSNDWDLWQEKYNYAFSSSGNIQTNWELNSDWSSLNDHPETVQFRFKALPSSSFTTETTQSLWSLDNGDPDKVRITLEYDANFSSGSYSGSIASTTGSYATLYFYSNNSDSGSITLPFIDDGWWSVMVTRTSTTDYNLYAGNKIYNGNDGYQIGYLASSSIAGTSGPWDSSINSNFPQIVDLPFGYTPFTGSYQEIRYYNEVLSVDTFKDYVMNPSSIEGTNTTGSYNQLAFRASLGGELYTGSTSIHPKVAGSSITQSFASDSDFTITNGNFVVNRETFFYDQFPAGMRNRNSDKIKQQNLVIPSGDTLSNIGSIQQKSYTTQDYTPNINLLEVAFSPQNEINDDIISQLGYFNIGDYIGDPRLVSSSAKTYPALEDLSKHYFDKYSSNYDVYDYIRLIKFFDNSLFKMVKDFVPARTSVATGIVVKQHLLERQKYPTPQAEYIQPEYTASIGSTPTLVDGARQFTHTTEFESIPIETITGSDGGAFGTLPTTISASVVGGPITSISLLDGGTGYAQNPSSLSITAVGGGGSGFVGQVDTIISQSILNSGTDLLSSITSTTIDFTPGTYNITEGNNLTTSNNVQVGLNIVIESGGTIESVSSSFSDTGTFDVSDTITIDNTLRNEIGMGNGTGDIVITLDSTLFSTKKIQVVDGQITSISINNGGSGYTSFPTLVIQSPVATWGTTATATINNIGATTTLTPVQSTQEFSGDYVTPLGIVPFTQDDSSELIDGEFGGSAIEVTDGDLTNYSIVPTLVYNQQGSSLGDQPINFSFNNDKNYLLEISATNNTGFSTSAFQIEDTTDPSYRLFTSPQIPDGDTFNTVISIKEFTINGKDLLTPNLTFSPVFFAGSGFNIVINIRENVAEDGALPLLNNAITDTKSKLFYDVDYSNNIIQAVNQQVLISSSQQGATSAPFAEIQDYNYYIDRSLLPRYKGSRITKDAVNSTSATASSYIQLGQPGQNLGVDTSGQPIIESLNTVAYNANFGGGTTPEILGLGGLSINSMLLIGSNRDDVNSIPSANANFSDIIQTSIEPGDLISVYQYGDTTVNVPGTLEVVETKLSVPPKSTYIIPSTGADTRAELTSSYFNSNTDSGIIFSGSNIETGGVFKVEINGNGNYQAGSTLQSGSTFLSEFKTRFDNSQNDWYVTLYDNIDSPVVYNGAKATINHEFTTDFTTSDPLGYYGVSKITQVISGSTKDGIVLDRDLTSVSGSDLGGGASSKGILIWESWGNQIIVRGNTLSGLGKSLVYSQNSPSTIKDNLGYISDTYGN